MKIYITLLTILISTISFCQSSTIRTWPSKNHLLNKSEVTHNNPELDNITNLLEADVVATYLGCENSNSNLERTNCLITNLTIFTTDKFINSGVLKTTHLKKGIKKLRVLFIIDENGRIKVRKILGKWPKTISDEMTKAIESAPKLIPAKLSGKNIPVKFSIRIPFTIK